MTEAAQEPDDGPQYEQLPLPIEIAEPEFDDDGTGEEHSGAAAQAVGEPRGD